MLRLLLILLAMMIIVRLLTIIIRTVKMYSRRNVPHEKKRKEEVGEGWIIEDRVDEDKKADS